MEIFLLLGNELLFYMIVTFMFGCFCGWLFTKLFQKK